MLFTDKVVAFGHLAVALALLRTFWTSAKGNGIFRKECLPAKKLELPSAFVYHHTSMRRWVRQVVLLTQCTRSRLDICPVR
jgi:hypothetical protein